MSAVTDIFLISCSDCSLYEWVMQKTVRHHYMKGEETTPVINQEVIFVSVQSLPHVILKRLLLKHGDPGGSTSLQLPIHCSGMSVTLIYYYERHLSHVVAIQPITQASNFGCLPEAELSGSLQQRHHSHVSQQVLHGCISLNVPLGGRFADPGGIIVPLHNQSAV